jgi:hypothetical protein
MCIVFSIQLRSAKLAAFKCTFFGVIETELLYEEIKIQKKTLRKRKAGKESNRDYIRKRYRALSPKRYNFDRDLLIY